MNKKLTLILSVPLLIFVLMQLSTSHETAAKKERAFISPPVEEKQLLKEANIEPLVKPKSFEDLVLSEENLKATENLRLEKKYPTQNSVVKAVEIGQGNYAQRNEAIRQIDFSRLSEKDRQHLYDYAFANPVQGSLINETSLQNNIMDRLITSRDSLPLLGEALIEAALDKTRDPVIRDYSIQHMAEYYGARWEGKPNEATEDKDKLFQAIHELLEDPVDGIAGTTLISLARIERDYQAIGQNELAKQADRIVRTNSVRNQVAALGFLEKSSENKNIILGFLSEPKPASVLQLRSLNLISSMALTPQEQRELNQYFTNQRKYKLRKTARAQQ